MPNLHLRVEAFARAILPLTSLAVQFAPVMCVKQFSKRQDTNAGMFPPAGEPAVYQIWYDRNPTGDTPLVPPGTAEPILTAYLFRELCELMSYIVEDAARKFLPADKCSVAWLRSHAKASLFLVEGDNTAQLPLHAFVHVMPLEDLDPDGAWIIDASLEQFGHSAWGGFARPEWYAENFVDLQRMKVYPSTPEHHQSMATDVGRSPYWMRVMEIIEQVLANFPWDAPRRQQEQRLDTVLENATSLFAAAAH